MLQDDGLMIVCDICSLWQHAVCFCILDEEHAPEEHVCDTCAKVGHKSNRRKKLLLNAGMQVFQLLLVFWHGTLEYWAVSSTGIFCWMSRVPNQNGVSQAWYIVEIHHSGQKTLKFYGMLKVFLRVLWCWFLYQSNIVHTWVPALLSLRLSGGHKWISGQLGYVSLLVLL